MRCLTPLLLLALVPGAHAVAQAAPVRADADSVARAELIALERHLSDLLNRGDWQAYAPNLADDYRQTTRLGEVRTKQEVLAALQRPRSADALTVLPDSIDVRVYGNTGVLTAVLIGRTGDGTAKYRSRILKTFVRRDGRWYLVAMQGTAIP